MDADRISIPKKSKSTGLFDKHSVEIKDGDMVSLGNVITGENSLGHLPNGWIFHADEDVYKVYFDKRIDDWSLKLGVEPDSPLNRKYMSHAVGLMYDGHAEIVN